METVGRLLERPRRCRGSGAGGCRPSSASLPTSGSQRRYLPSETTLKAPIRTTCRSASCPSASTTGRAKRTTFPDSVISCCSSEPELLERFDRGQRLGLAELSRGTPRARGTDCSPAELSMLPAVSPATCRTTPKSSPRVPRRSRSVVLQLGRAHLVLLEMLLHLLAARLRGDTRRSRLGELRLLPVLRPLELLLRVSASPRARRASRPGPAAAARRGSWPWGRRPGRGPESRRRAAANCDREDAFHRASSAAGMGSRRRSGATCLRAIRRPCRIAGWSSLSSVCQARSDWFQAPTSRPSRVWYRRATRPTRRKSTARPAP